MKFIILGLGNPGKKYERTRHNAGFMAVDQIGRSQGISINQEKFHSLIGRGRIDDHEAVLAKPLTFMNESGRAAAALLRDNYLDAGSIIVLHDELDLPLGTVRIKSGGGHGGHNGLRSLMDHLGTAEFMRVRIGIGRPGPAVDTATYVLSVFTPEERSLAEESWIRAADAAVAVVTGGLARAMNLFNQK